MSAPILLVCREDNLPTVNSLNNELDAMGYQVRLDEAMLWPGREYGVLSIIRDGTRSTLHLSKRSVREECDYIARILRRVAPQQPDKLETEINAIENLFGDRLVETCYSWDDNGLALAEVHHAFARVAKAHLWRAGNGVNSQDILQTDDTENHFAESVEYQRKQLSHRQCAQSIHPISRSAGTPSTFLKFSHKIDVND